MIRASKPSKGLFLISLLFLSFTGLPALSLNERSRPAWAEAYRDGQKALIKRDLAGAEKCFRMALTEVQCQSHVPADKEICIKSLADTLALRYKTDEARQMYRALLALDIRLYGPTSSKTSLVEFALGSIEEAAGFHRLAMDYYARALAHSQKYYGPYSPGFVGVIHASEPVWPIRRTGEATMPLSQRADFDASIKLEEIIHERSDAIAGEDESYTELVRDFDRDILSQKSKSAGPGPARTRADASLVPPPPPAVPISMVPSSTLPAAQDLAVPQSQSGAVPSAASEAVPVPAVSQPQCRPTEPPATDDPLSSPDCAWKIMKQAELDLYKDNQTDYSTGVALRTVPHPESDVSLYPAYKVVAKTIFNQNHYGTAETHMKRMIATDIDTLGPHHPAVADDLVGLAQLYIDERRFKEAEELLKKALCIYQPAYGQNNLVVIDTIISLACTKMRLGDNKGASLLLHAAFANGQMILGPNHIDMASILNDLAGTSVRQGRLEEACTFYKWAVASTEEAAGKDSPLLAASLIDFSQLLNNLGRKEEAVAAQMRANIILANYIDKSAGRGVNLRTPD